MKCFILLIVPLVYLNSCTNPQDDSDLQSRIKSFFDDKKRVSDLINKSMNDGDTVAYKELHYFYYIGSREQEITYVSMAMAYKHNYPKAFFHIYSELSNRNHGTPLLLLDERTRNLSLYYLALAKEKGCRIDNYEWEKAYGNKPIPSSSTFLLKLAKLDSAKVK